MGVRKTLDRIFGISAHGSTVTTEIRGGITSFLTMAYILVVNPQILSQAGMPAGDVAVGGLMMSGVRDLEWNDPADTIPAFLTLVLMPLTYSIATGIAFGMMSWVFLRVLGGRRREVTPMMWVLCLVLIFFFAFSSAS